MSVSSSRSKRVVIAGAGLVGPLLAIFLRRRGFNVSLHERRASDPSDSPPPDDSRRSINLIITSRGINALNQLGLWNEAKKLTVPVRGRMIHSLRGDVSFHPYGRDDNECNYSISRIGLNRFLLKRAATDGVNIQFHSPLESVDLKNHTATFRNESMTYDLFFGADGAGSVARHALENCGHAKVHTEWLDAEYKELVIPSELGQKIDRHALHIWPRGTHMMMALPNLEGDQTVTLYLPRTSHEYAFENMRTADEVEALFQSQFLDAIGLMPNYKDDFFNNPQGRLGTVRASTWIYEDSFCLIGDAAHAIVPFFGQGMNLGFEDCTTLMGILDDSDSWTEVLKRFDAIQRPNANAIADMALENFVEMRDRVGQADFQLKKKIEARIEHELPELYRSRYGMVTYTLIPYALAQQAGKIQYAILDEIAAKATPSGDFDLSFARDLIEQHLTPFYRKHGLNTSKFLPE